MSKLDWVCKKHKSGNYFPAVNLNWCPECHDEYLKEKARMIDCRCGACNFAHPDDPDYRSREKRNESRRDEMERIIRGKSNHIREK